MKPLYKTFQVTPFLIICSLLALWSLINIITIYSYDSAAVVELPIWMFLLISSLIFLGLDRFLIKRISLKRISLFELGFLSVSFLAFSLNQRKLVIEPSSRVNYFSIVQGVDEAESTATQLTFPFNKKILVEKNGLMVYLSDEQMKTYNLSVKSDCSIYSSTTQETIADEQYLIHIYSMCAERKDLEDIRYAVLSRLDQ